MSESQKRLRLKALFGLLVEFFFFLFFFWRFITVGDATVLC